MNDRHAVVTGGGGGLGAASARALSAAGFRLTLIGRDEARLQSVADALPAALCAPADITNEAEVRAALEEARAELGPVSVLVNNAGVSPSAPFLKTSRTQWDQTLGVNLTGAYLCTQVCLPDMLEAGWGRVINIASTAGLKGYGYVAAYCAAKHGLIGLTRALAQEVARQGVTVNALCPGFADTEMTEASVARIGKATGLDEDTARQRLADYSPQGRLIAPDEVGAAVAWLASNAAASVNGAAIPIAGGEI